MQLYADGIHMQTDTKQRIVFNVSVQHSDSANGMDGLETVTVASFQAVLPVFDRLSYANTAYVLPNTGGNGLGTRISYGMLISERSNDRQKNAYTSREQFSGHSSR